MIRQIGVLLVIMTYISVTAAERPLVCPYLYSPVCASNGKTYSSECEMRFAGDSLKVVSPGECPKSEQPTNQDCLVCPAILLPVCGTDGKTYSNDCDLRCNGNGATLAYRGSCNA